MWTQAHTTEYHSMSCIVFYMSFLKVVPAIEIRKSDKIITKKAYWMKGEKFFRRKTISVHTK